MENQKSGDYEFVLYMVESHWSVRITFSINENGQIVEIGGGIY